MTILQIKKILDKSGFELRNESDEFTRYLPFGDHQLCRINLFPDFMVVANSSCMVEFPYSAMYSLSIEKKSEEKFWIWVTNRKKLKSGNEIFVNNITFEKETTV